MRRNVIPFDHRISRNVAKAICERHGSTVKYLDETGRFDLGGGRGLTIIHSGRRKLYLYTDQNRNNGMLDVRRMPEEVREAAIEQMCREFDCSRNEIMGTLEQYEELEKQQAVMHALTTG